MCASENACTCSKSREAAEHAEPLSFNTVATKGNGTWISDALGGGSSSTAPSGFGAEGGEGPPATLVAIVFVAVVVCVGVWVAEEVGSGVGVDLEVAAASVVATSLMMRRRPSTERTHMACRACVHMCVCVRVCLCECGRYFTDDAAAALNGAHTYGLQSVCAYVRVCTCVFM